MHTAEFCLCEKLPADFDAGMDHHPRCPAGHRYRGRSSGETPEATCQQCDLGPEVHVR